MGAADKSPTSSKLKRLIGNNMKLTLIGNLTKSYMVVGNNNKILVENNVTSVEIVGNNCEVVVKSGRGSVVYMGNNGSVFLETEVEEDVVTYLGNNGRVSGGSGLIQRHCSHNDVRGGHYKDHEVIRVSNVEGKYFRVGAKVARKLTHLTSTISLPNIQVNLSTANS